MRITQDNKDTEDWKIIFHNFNPQNNIESINFEINKGDKIVIKGESGIGKSTFLHNVFFQEKFQTFGRIFSFLYCYRINHVLGLDHEF